VYPQTATKGWWQHHGMCASIRLRTLEEDLAVTTSPTSGQTHMVPLFLQTDDYMREVLLASSTAPETELQAQVRAQLAMRESLRGSVKCTHFVHESALHLPVGGAQIRGAAAALATHDEVGQHHHPDHARRTGRAPVTRLAFAKSEPLVWMDTENSSLLTEAAVAIGWAD
jgi:Domain of unknown function (DUF5753)